MSFKNGFSKRQQKNLTKERELELAPVAKEIIKMIAEADLPVGEIHARDNSKFNDVSEKILRLLLRKDIKYVDKDFLFQLVLQPIDMIKQTVMISLGKSFDDAIDQSLGKGFREIRMTDLDEILRVPKKE